MKNTSKILKIIITLVLAALLIMQEGCASSKHGMVPCPCKKKDNRR